MIVTSYTPNLKSPFSNSELETVSFSNSELETSVSISALTGGDDAHDVEDMLLESPSSGSSPTNDTIINNPLPHLPLADLKCQAAVFDQNTFFSYVYCFIKNFIGATGTNTVAIDNKIEQAMDLVKSHLMFAVREEVEVLKEKIAELMERINQLEYENTILRAHATPETLALLQKPPSANGNPPNNNPPL